MCRPAVFVVWPDGKFWGTFVGGFDVGCQDLGIEQLHCLVKWEILTVRIGGRPTSSCAEKPKACAMRE